MGPAPPTPEEHQLPQTRSLARAAVEGAARLRLMEEGKSDKLQECLELLRGAWTEALERGVLRAASAEDLSDADLRCLLLPAYLSQAMERSAATGPAARLRLVERVDATQREFLRWCARLDVMEASDVRAFERDEDEAPRRKPTAAEERSAAIERMRRKDAARQKLETLKTSELDEDDDHENVREVVEAEIAYAILRALDDLRLRKRELEMLRHVAGRLPPDEEHPPPTAPPQQQQHSSDEEWLRAPADGQGLRVLRTSLGGDGRLQLSKERIKAKVFEPDPRRLPTKSLAQQADEELKEALEREERSKQQKNDPANDNRRTKDLHEEGEEDDEHLYDQATKRDEAWDTWREHHKRGSGNKGNHIY